MSRSGINLVRAVGRGLQQNATAGQRAPLFRRIAQGRVAFAPRTAMIYRSFGISATSRKGLSPESEHPDPRKPDDVNTVPKTPAPLEDSEYHEIADDYLDTVLGKLEDVAEQRPDVDVEFSSGVLTLTFPPLGTYVINKQPPNKQIWLSSPISGPKRYDYVIIGDGQNQKEGTGSGDWVYLRDGTTLSGLLLDELKVDVTTP